MAEILNGKAVASEIEKNLQQQVRQLKEQYPSFTPGLVMIQIGNHEESNMYVRVTMKSAEEVGVKASNIRLPDVTTEHELMDTIKKLNEDPDVHGIIILLPLQSVEAINADVILDAISPAKDVEGMRSENVGKLCRGELSERVIPCAPQGCLELIKSTGVAVSGQRAVVIGRSKIVGMPMANLLIWNHATVTVCHSRTVNLADVVKEADIVIAAIGRPEFVKGDWIKPGAIVVDCGINSIVDETSNSGKRLVGDVDFEAARLVASWITPVPGGVGPMTVAMLLSNTILCAKRQLASALVGTGDVAGAR
jgi:methylenetetrahydrofolate dehydrogenase (NADP+)/methenyltetrahydrofolate cyclohydrolase/formyltetrahydrofolate synthetase